MTVYARDNPAVTRAPSLWHVPAAAAMLLILALALLAMGREPICTCGIIKLWHGEVMSSENSQHLMDWYTPSHVLHGVIFYFVLQLMFPKVPFAVRLLLALGIECAWEFLENTPAMIERYRSATISLDYFGDSVINSLADASAMIAGFWLAGRLPVRLTIYAALATEIATAVIIRDNLTLNVLMLLYPLDGIKTWQAAI